MTFRGTASNKPERIGSCIGRHVRNQHAPFLCAHCPTRPSPTSQASRVPVLSTVRKGRKQHHGRRIPPLPSDKSRLAGH